MANITIPGLPAKTGTISDAAYLHLNESSVDKKVTIAQLLSKISAQYSANIVTFLGSANNAEARANLGIDRRTTVSDAIYTILATDKVVAQVGTMSAARIWSLPAASTFPAGGELLIIDESGTVTSTNKITVQRNGADTIDGLTEKVINNAYGILKLICDGSNSWKVLENYATNKSKGLTLLDQMVILSNNGSDPDHDIDFSEGVISFSDNSGKAYMPAITKRADAAWASGTGNGGMADSESLPATGTLHCFELTNDDGTLTDAGFSSTDSTGATLLASTAVVAAGLTKVKRVGSLRTNGSNNILGFNMKKTAESQASFTFDSSIVAFSGATPSTTPVDLTLQIPSGLQMGAILSGVMGHSGAACWYKMNSKVEGGQLYVGAIGNVASSRSHICPPKPILTDTSNTIQHSHDVSLGSSSVVVYLDSYLDYDL